MKTKLQSLFIGLALLAGVHRTTAQVTNLGIAPAPGGRSVLYWPVSSTNYVVQTTTNLATPNWVTASNAITVNAATVTNSAPAGYFRLLATTNTTAGMVLIPAGSFTMGNYLFYNSATNDPDITDANPTNVYVSAFYMDVNLVSYGQWTNVSAYATSHGYSFVHAGLGKNSAANHPVQTVDWFDMCEVVQCAVAAGGFDAGVLHGCGIYAGVSRMGTMARRFIKIWRRKGIGCRRKRNGRRRRGAG